MNSSLKVTFSDEQLEKLDKDELIKVFKQQTLYLNQLEDNENKLKELNEAKAIEILKLKNVLLMKYMMKEQEQSATNVSQDTQSASSKLKQTLTDPCVNLVIMELKKELDECKRQREEALNELNSYKFTNDSNMGKRLISKCQKLFKENEELGKLVSSGNLSNLEADIAYHKKLLEEAYENEKHIHTFVNEMDKEMDAMQATIFQLQQKIHQLQNDENNNNKI